MKKDVTIIGAGLVGLATAYQLNKRNPELKIAILEKENKVAAHQSGHNSGVIHSGVYYKQGSLKAKCCTEGKKALLDFCHQEGIPYKKTGKVIIATEKEELSRLEEVAQRGRGNGVPLEIIGPEKLKEIEPYATGLKAIWIPECSIIDYKQVAQALHRVLERKGVEVLFQQKVTQIEETLEGYRLKTESEERLTSTLINCAGLFADRLAKISPLSQKVPYRILPFRGEYYMLSEEKGKLVNGLIYPIPDPKFPFLGVHLTRMMSGDVEAGPNAVLALSKEGYKKSDFNLSDCLHYLQYKGFWKMTARYWDVGFYEMYRSLRKKVFLRDLQRLMPSIEEKDLSPGGSGVRAQVVTPEGTMLYDFSLLEEKGMIHVLNAPSPAATSCLAIGDYIANRVESLSRA